MRRLARRWALLPCLAGLVLLSLLALRPLPPGPEDQWEENSPIPPDKLTQLLAEGEEGNRQRILRVERVCREHNLGVYKTDSDQPPSYKYPPTPQYSVFYFDLAHKLAYCPTYKAGSTTWLHNLLTLNQVPEERIRRRQISEAAREIFPQLDGDEAENKFPASRRLLCVRHPFDRLLSAYRDKLEDRDRAPQHGTLHYYRRWGSRIRAKYRDSGRPEPTFQEFARYLIDTDLLLYSDDHWIPYNAFCTPCLIRYDYVATVETLTEDQLFFIHSLGLEGSLSPSRHHSSEEPSSHLASRYFSQLSKDQVRQLHQKYSLDFQMFGYSIEPYLTYAKD